MNIKNNLVPGTIKGIQIVDLEKAILKTEISEIIMST